MTDFVCIVCECSYRDEIEINVFEINVFEINVFEVNVFEVNVFEVNVFEINVFEVNVFEVNVFEVNVFEINVFEINVFTARRTYLLSNLDVYMVHIHRTRGSGRMGAGILCEHLS
jgi:hypothetical protein